MLHDCNLMFLILTSICIYTSKQFTDIRLFCKIVWAVNGLLQIHELFLGIFYLIRVDKNNIDMASIKTTSNKNYAYFSNVINDWINLYLIHRNDNYKPKNN